MRYSVALGAVLTRCDDRDAVRRGAERCPVADELRDAFGSLIGRCCADSVGAQTRHPGRVRNWNVRDVFRLHGLHTFRFSRWFFWKLFAENRMYENGRECSRPFFVISLHSLLLLTTGAWILKGRKHRQLHSILEKSGYDNRCSTSSPNAIRRAGR